MDGKRRRAECHLRKDGGQGKESAERGSVHDEQYRRLDGREPGAPAPIRQTRQMPYHFLAGTAHNAFCRRLTTFQA